MALLNEEEKRALRQRQKLLYSSGQFPLRGDASRRPRRRMSPLQMVLVGFVLVVGAAIALIAILTSAG